MRNEFLLHKSGFFLNVSPSDIKKEQKTEMIRLDLGRYATKYHFYVSVESLKLSCFKSYSEDLKNTAF